MENVTNKGENVKSGKIDISISEIRKDHLFWSNKSESIWMVIDINSERVIVNELKPNTMNQTILTSAFIEALHNNVVSFEKFEYQNKVLDAFKKYLNPQDGYAKRHHWGGTK